MLGGSLAHDLLLDQQLSQVSERPHRQSFITQPSAVVSLLLGQVVRVALRGNQQRWALPLR
jgi:hypothetical protein